MPQVIVLPGTPQLEITGSGFLSAGGSAAANHVTLNGVLLPAPQWSDTRVVVPLPTDADELQRLGLMRAGDTEAGALTVIDDRAASSPPYSVQLVKGSR